jgi:hypothetical protein
MSLSSWEQQALDSIRDHLASSHPALVARLAIFTRLASDEEMPAREKIPVGARPVRRSRSGPPAARRPHAARRAYRRLGFQRAALLLWLVTTAALISVALVVSHGGTQSRCTGAFATLCTGASSTSKSASPVP